MTVTLSDLKWMVACGAAKDVTNGKLPANCRVVFITRGARENNGGLFINPKSGAILKPTLTLLRLGN